MHLKYNAGRNGNKDPCKEVKHLRDLKVCKERKQTKQKSLTEEKSENFDMLSTEYCVSKNQDGQEKAMFYYSK